MDVDDVSGEIVLLAMSRDEALAAWHAICTTVDLIDAVATDVDNPGIPPDAPLYGQRGRLVGVARRLDHELNCAAR